MAGRRKDVAPTPAARARLHPSRAPRAAVTTKPTTPPNPLQSHRRMNDMSEPELRAYAVQAGVSKRDAERLSVDRLKQNIQFVLYDLIDSL